MDWLGISGLILGVVGIPLAFIVGRRNRQRPDLRVVSDFNQIAAPGDFAGVKLAWKGQPLEQVSRTSLAFWNHRGDHVEGSSILDSDPLRIEVEPDDSILHVRLVTHSRDQNALQYHDGRVTFDFLDAGDGGVLEVLHWGDAPAWLEGTIRGSKIRWIRFADLGPRGRAKARTPRFRRVFSLGDNRALRLISIAAFLLGVAVLVLGLIYVNVSIREPDLVPPDDYKLTTLEGQSEFAREIQREGIYNPNPTVLGVMFGAYGLLFVMAIGTVVIRSRSIVPRSIVRNDIDVKTDIKTSDV